jgi:hypothetical protein
MRTPVRACLKRSPTQRSETVDLRLRFFSFIWLPLFPGRLEYSILGERRELDHSVQVLRCAHT